MASNENVSCLTLFLITMIQMHVWLQDKVYQFCSKTCCEDYKKLHCIVTFCEYCQEEKTLHEVVKFSGVKRPFCSEGTPLLEFCVFSVFLLMPGHISDHKGGCSPLLLVS